VSPFSPASLNVSNLACHRGGRRVFVDVNFTLQNGEWLELRGPNGSGKSSLLRLLARLDEPAAGQINFAGPEHRNEAYRNEALHLIGHGEASKPALTVRENLQFWSDFLGGGDVAPSLAAFNMKALADVSTALLSEGQKRRLALTRLALIPRPLWLLDEPSVGLDQTTLTQLQGAMRDHLQRGGMIIASTHIDLGLAPTKTLQLEATQ
jgi:heme exporter protein A